MKKELAALKKRLQDGSWNYFALCSSDGGTLVPVSRGKLEANRKAADLEHIFSVIDDYPDETLVIDAYLNKAKGTKPKTFIVPTNAKTLDSPPVISQAHTADIQTAERLGSLETENSFLKAKISELEQQLSDFNRLVDEDELEDDGEDMLEEEPKVTWAEYLAPAIPGLLDKASALLDVYINKKMVGANGNFQNTVQPPAFIQEPPPPQVLDIDYDKLADMVAKKLEQNGNY